MVLGSEYDECAVVLLAFFVVYSFMVYFDAFVKSTPAKDRWSGRAFGNLREQTPLFLVSFLTCAAFDPELAVPLGLLWVALAAAYPVLWALGGGMSFLVFVSTIPRYCLCTYMIANRALPHALGGFNPFDLVGDNLAARCAVCFPAQMCLIALTNVFGFVFGACLKEGKKSKRS